MFRLLKREREMGSSTSKPKHLSSQSTAELSFTSDDYEGSSEVTPVLTDYESDSLEDLERQDSMGSCCTNSPRMAGGLRRSTSPGRRKTVTFSQVKVRRYALTVGDNPAVSLGVPIALDWKIVSEETAIVGQYDDTHPKGCTEEQLALSAEERESMVRQAGYTTEDIRSAVREVNNTKMLREKTIDTLESASKEEFMEKLKSGVLNATFRRKSKQREREMLQSLKAKDAKWVVPACA